MYCFHLILPPGINRIITEQVTIIVIKYYAKSKSDASEGDSDAGLYCLLISFKNASFFRCATGSWILSSRIINPSLA